MRAAKEDGVGLLKASSSSVRNSSALVQRLKNTQSEADFPSREADLTGDDKNGHQTCMSSFSRCAPNINADCSTTVVKTHLCCLCTRCLSFALHLSLPLISAALHVWFESHP